MSGKGKGSGSRGGSGRISIGGYVNGSPGKVTGGYQGPTGTLPPPPTGNGGSGGSGSGSGGKN